jgi:hypothetical protein
MHIVRRLCLIATVVCMLPLAAAQSCPTGQQPVCSSTPTTGNLAAYDGSSGGTTTIQNSGISSVPDCPRVVDYPGWNVTVFDINYVIAQELTGNGTCVSFYGLSGVYYGAATTPPFSGITNPSNEIEIQWPSNVQIVTSAPWVTPNLVNIAIMAVPGGGNSGASLSMCPIPAPVGCGPHNYPAFIPWNNVVSGGFNPGGGVGGIPLGFVTATGSVAISSGQLGGTQMTAVPNITNSSGNNQTAGGYIVLNSLSGIAQMTPYPAYCTASGNSCDSLWISSVGGTSGSWTLNFTDTLSNLSGPTLVAGTYKYVIYQPNATVLLWVGGLGKGPTLNSFGSRIGPLKLDGEGIEGFVGLYEQQLQEDTRIQVSGSYDLNLITGSRSSQGAGLACFAGDRGFQPGALLVGGPSHAYLEFGECDMNLGTSNSPWGQATTTSNYPSFGYILEENALTKPNVADGPNGMANFGTCEGTGGVNFNWFTACLFYEGLKVEFAPLHEEFAQNGVWLGEYNPTNGVIIHNPSTSNTANAPAQCGNGTPGTPCVLTRLDTNANWGNQVIGGDGTGYANVDLVYDASNGCGDGTGPPCAYNTTVTGTGSTAYRHQVGRVLPGTYYQPNTQGTGSAQVPTLLGTPAASTPVTSDSSLKVATTAYVQNQGYETTSAAQAAFSGIGGCTNGVVSGLNANAPPNCATVFSEVYATASITTSGSLGATPMVTSPSAPTLYRISFYAFQVGAGSGGTCTSSTVVAANVIFQDPLASAATTFTLTNLYIAGAGTANTPMVSQISAAYSSYVFRAKATSNVQYSTAVTPGNCTTKPTYFVIPLLEQL